jgi:hypothetical protein
MVRFLELKRGVQPSESRPKKNYTENSRHHFNLNSSPILTK